MHRPVAAEFDRLQPAVRLPHVQRAIDARGRRMYASAVRAQQWSQGRPLGCRNILFELASAPWRRQQEGVVVFVFDDMLHNFSQMQFAGVVSTRCFVVKAAKVLRNLRCN